MRSIGLRKILPVLLVVALAGGCSISQDVATIGLKGDMSGKIQNAQRDAERFYQMGRYFQGQLRYVEAVNAYRDCLKLAPDHVEARNAMGVSLALLGRYEEAILVFNELAGQEPNSARYWHNLGYAYLLAGEAQPATEALQRAITLDPENTKAQAYLALAQANTANSSDTSFSVNSVNEEVSMAAAQVKEQEPNSLATANVTDEPGSNGVVDNKQATLMSIGQQVYELRINKGGSEAAKTLMASDQQNLHRPAENVSMSSNLRGVEISNGNGVTGMGKRVAKFLIQEGGKTARLTNQVGFKVRQTELHYRDGYRNQAALLAGLLQHPVVLKEAVHLRSDINVKLVLGRDVARLAEAMPESFDASGKLASREIYDTNGG